MVIPTNINLKVYAYFKLAGRKQSACVITNVDGREKNVEICVILKRTSVTHIFNSFPCCMYKCQLQIEKGNYKIRQLLENEFLLYKSLRLEAIQTEPAMFRCSTPAESDLTDVEWQERIRHPRAVFGLFENQKPIGMTSILLLNEKEGYLGQSYIRKEYRGLKLSTLFYEVRMAWALNLQLKQLKVSHRESNIISKAANQRSGFKYSYRESAVWLDGTAEDVLYYVLELKQNHPL